MQVLNIQNLDNPTLKVDKQTLCKNYPFFNDFYCIVYLKPVTIPQVGYKPHIITDPDLANCYYSRCLHLIVKQIVETGDKIVTTNFYVRYAVFVLMNGWWCMYIEKHHTWDDFHNCGVILIQSPVKNNVMHFFKEFFDK